VLGREVTTTKKNRRAAGRKLCSPRNRDGEVKRVEDAGDGEADDEVDGDRDEDDDDGVAGEDVPELLLLRGLGEEEEYATAVPSPRSVQRTAANDDGDLRQVFFVLRTN
jgi:hypothetical protein